MPDPFVVAFVIGVTPGKWARVWSERMPALPLALQPLPQAAALAALAGGTADVALLRLPVADPALAVIPLYAEQPVVVAPKGHTLEAADAVTLAELAGFDVLGEAAGDTGWAGVIELVAANAGIAIIPQSVARALSRRDVTARPVTDVPGTRVALAWPTERTTPAVEEFVGIVRGRTANSSRGAVAASAVPAVPAGKSEPQKRQPARPPRTRPKRRG